MDHSAVSWKSQRCAGKNHDKKVTKCVRILTKFPFDVPVKYWLKSSLINTLLNTKSIPLWLAETITKKAALISEHGHYFIYSVFLECVQGCPRVIGVASVFLCFTLLLPPPLSLWLRTFHSSWKSPDCEAAQKTWKILTFNIRNL